MINYLGFVRYSVLRKDGKGWKIGGQSEGYEQYRERLFDDDRLNFKFRCLSDIVLESIQGQDVSLDDLRFKIVVLTSEYLPEHHLKDVLELKKKYQWLDVCLVSEEPSGIRDSVRDYVAGFCNEGDYVFTFRLDDDDALGKSYLSSLVSLLNPGLDGFAVSFPKGLVGFFDEKEGSYTWISDIYRPKTAIGLGVYSRFVGKSFISIFDLGNHADIDLKVPLVSFASNVAYLRTLHKHGDQYYGRSKKSSWRRSYSMLGEPCSVSKVGEQVRVSESVMPQFEFSDLRKSLSEGERLPAVEIKFSECAEGDWRYALYEIKRGEVIKKHPYQSDRIFMILPEADEVVGFALKQNGDKIRKRCYNFLASG